MKIDPDSAEIKLKWYESRWLLMAGAVGWVGIGLLNLKLSDYRGSFLNIIGAVAVGVVVGWGVSLFDLWWGKRPAVKLVATNRTDWRRRIPPLVFEITALAATWLVLYKGDSLGVVVWSVAIATDYLFVMPRYARRNAAKRVLKAFPARPDLS
jgi:hypothetical protein